MFTGLVGAVGTLAYAEPLGRGRRLAIATPWAEDLAVGESVAVDGCCLTVVGAGEGVFHVEAVRETLERTTLGEHRPGRRVHLERALAVGDRIGGHFLQGHVDRVGTLAALEGDGEIRYISIDLLAREDLRLVAPQGSIGVDGVSLTVLGVTASGFRVAIVPHTWEVTTFRDRAAGDRVNVEFDLMARYVARLLETAP